MYRLTDMARIIGVPPSLMSRFVADAVLPRRPRGKYTDDDLAIARNHARLYLESRLPDGTQLYTIDELSDLTGISVRTIRRYIMLGVIPKSYRSGRHGGYSERHIRALKRLAEMKSQNRTIAQIGEELRREGLI